MSQWWYRLAFWTLLVAAVIAAVGFVRAPRRGACASPAPLLVAVLGYVLLLHMAEVLLVINNGGLLLQGRYLLPIVPLLEAVLLLGLARLGRVGVATAAGARRGHVRDLDPGTDGHAGVLWLGASSSRSSSPCWSTGYVVLRDADRSDARFTVVSGPPDPVIPTVMPRGRRATTVVATPVTGRGPSLPAGRHLPAAAEGHDRPLGARRAWQPASPAASSRRVRTATTPSWPVPLARHLTGARARSSRGVAPRRSRSTRTTGRRASLVRTRPHRWPDASRRCCRASRCRCRTVWAAPCCSSSLFGSVALTALALLLAVPDPSQLAEVRRRRATPTRRVARPDCRATSAWRGRLIALAGAAALAVRVRTCDQVGGQDRRALGLEVVARRAPGSGTSAPARRARAGRSGRSAAARGSTSPA